MGKFPIKNCIPASLEKLRIWKHGAHIPAQWRCLEQSGCCTLWMGHVFSFRLQPSPSAPPFISFIQLLLHAGPFLIGIFEFVTSNVAKKLLF